MVRGHFADVPCRASKMRHILTMQALGQKGSSQVESWSGVHFLLWKIPSVGSLSIKPRGVTRHKPSFISFKFSVKLCTHTTPKFYFPCRHYPRFSTYLPPTFTLYCFHGCDPLHLLCPQFHLESALSSPSPYTTTTLSYSTISDRSGTDIRHHCASRRRARASLQSPSKSPHVTLPPTIYLSHRDQPPSVQQLSCLRVQSIQGFSVTIGVSPALAPVEAPASTHPLKQHSVGI